MSCAVVFAHIKTPLTRVLSSATDLLDMHAKDTAGRDGIAIEVQKPGGSAARWCMPWERVLASTVAAGPADLELVRISRLISATAVRGEFSSKFFYKLRELLPVLPLPETTVTSATSWHRIPDLALDLATSLYMATFGSRGHDLPHARSVVEPLLAQMLPVQRQIRKTAHGLVVNFGLRPREMYTIDAALIARFLAQKGKEHS